MLLMVVVVMLVTSTVRAGLLTLCCVVRHRCIGVDICASRPIWKHGSCLEASFGGPEMVIPVCLTVRPANKRYHEQ